MALSDSEQQAWDQYFSAAMIAIAGKPVKATGGPLDDLANAPQSVAFRAAGMADAMLVERRKR